MADTFVFDKFSDSDTEKLVCFSGDDIGILFRDRPAVVTAWTDMDDLNLDKMPVAYLPRGYAENSDEFVQFVVYSLIMCGDKVLVYSRGNSTESRLSAKLSIGIGGHVNVGDCDLEEFDHNQVEAVALERELYEELGSRLGETVLEESSVTDWYSAMIYDRSNSVGRAHLGAVSVSVVDEATADAICRSRSVDLSEPRFVELAELRKPDSELFLQLEPWSKLLVSADLSVCFGEFIDSQNARYKSEEAEIKENIKPCAEMLFDETKGSPDPLRYNPHRDVAYCHGPKVIAMVKLLEADACSDLFGLGLSGEQIASAISVYCKYLDNVREYGKYSTAAEAMQAAGWFDLYATQRLAITSTLGSLYSVMAFQAQREVDSVKSGAQVAAGREELFNESMRACRSLTRGRWSRLWSSIKNCIWGSFCA